MKKNRNTGISFPSPDKALCADNQRVGLNVDTITDTSIKTPTLHDFGGDTSKRWYIDYYIEKQRERKWITARPVATRPERAKKELEKIKKLYKESTPRHYNLYSWIDLKDNSKRTKDTYKSYAKEFHELFPEPSTFTPAILFESINDGREPKTLKNIFLGIKTLFNFAHKEKLIITNPFSDENVKLPTVHSDESEYNCPFTDYERRLIEPKLKEVPGLYLLTRFIYYTFGRVNELRLLKIRDINLQTRTIKLRADTTKGKRTIIKPILNQLLDLMLSHNIFDNPGHFYVFGENFKPGPEPQPVNYASGVHRGILQDLNLYRPYETVLYSWKPTGAISAYMAGMDIRLIQEMCGHKSIQHTEIYLRKLGLFIRKEAYEISF